MITDHQRTVDQLERSRMSARSGFVTLQRIDHCMYALTFHSFSIVESKKNEFIYSSIIISSGCNMSGRRLVTTLSLVVIALAIIIRLALSNVTVIMLIDDMLDWLQDGGTYNTHSNRYLRGNFRPISDEMHGVELEVISGSISHDLNGIFLRVGQCHTRAWVQ